MKNKLQLLSCLLLFLVGITLTIMHDKAQILQAIIMIIGIMFAIPSCIALIALFTNRFGKLNALVAFPMGGGLILGIVLIATPSFFVGALAYTFAALLIIGALYKIWLLLSVGKKIKFPLWIYIIPCALIVSGIAILTTEIRTIESTLVLVTGIALIAYSVNTLIECLICRKHQRNFDGSVIEVDESSHQ